MVAEKTTRELELDEIGDLIPKKGKEVFVLFPVEVNVLPEIIAARIDEVLDDKKIEIDREVPEGSTPYLDISIAKAAFAGAIDEVIMEPLRARVGAAKEFASSQIQEDDTFRKILKDGFSTEELNDILLGEKIRKVRKGPDRSSKKRIKGPEKIRTMDDHLAYLGIVIKEY